MHNYSVGISRSVKKYLAINSPRLDALRPNPYLHISVAPNPVQDHGNITVYGLYSVPDALFSLKLFDLLGNEVVDLTSQIQLNGSRTIAQAMLEDLTIANGIYMLRFTADEVVKTLPVVIMKK